MQLTASVLAYLLLRRTGRRPALVGCLLSAAALLAGAAAADHLLSTDVISVPALVAALSAGSAVAAAGGRCCLVLLSAEVVPTERRGLALGVCLLAGTAATQVAPHLLQRVGIELELQTAVIGVAHMEM